MNPFKKINDNTYQDDSGILFRHNYLDHIKKFIYYLIEFDDEKKYVHIEKYFHNYLEKKFKIFYTDRFIYRIGTGVKLSEIPYYNKLCKDKLISLEYKIE